MDKKHSQLCMCTWGRESPLKKIKVHREKNCKHKYRIFSRVQEVVFLLV